MEPPRDAIGHATGVRVDVLLPDDADAPAVVRLQGELDLAEVGVVDAELTPVIARAERDVIIDLEDLVFIDVSGVNLLVRTAVVLHAADRALHLRAPSPILVRMLRLTGLEEHLPIVAPVEG